MLRYKFNLFIIKSFVLALIFKSEYYYIQK